MVGDIVADALSLDTGDFISGELPRISVVRLDRLHTLNQRIFRQNYGRLTRLCGNFPFVPCHSECSEESEVCEWRMCNDFRFFTPLRCVQNDRIKMRCAAFRMTE